MTGKKPFVLSIPDMAILGAAALLLFGPDQLPRVARKAGSVMRDIQNTSQSFIREMERAADMQDAGARAEPPPYEPAAYDPIPYNVVEEPVEESAAEEIGAVPERRLATGDTAYEPPAPDPETPLGARPSVAEKLAEPRPALGHSASIPPEPPPQAEHPAHL